MSLTAHLHLTDDTEVPTVFTIEGRVIFSAEGFSAGMSLEQAKEFADRIYQVVAKESMGVPQRA